MTVDPIDTAQETLDAILGFLGFAATVTVDRATSSLHVSSSDGTRLIGPQGETREEIQHLVNRILEAKVPDAPASMWTSKTSGPPGTSA